VRPLLEVNIQAFSPYLHRDMLAIESVQRRATKRVIGLRFTPYPERLRILNLFPTDYRRFRGDLILMHKIMHQPGHPLRSLFEPCRSATTRGHPYKVQTKHSHTNKRKYSFCVRVCNPWNSLPFELVTLDRADAFKKGMDKLYREEHLGFRSLVFD